MATSRLQPFLRDFDNPYAADGSPHVQSISIQGPFNAKTSGGAPSPNVFVCNPGANASQAAETACATRIISTLARRAYRRPVSNAEVTGLLSFYQQERARGSFEAGVEFALRRILASPSFVFRPEREPAGIAPGTPYKVTPVELASRLSFFLWSSIPDEDLLRSAAGGQLDRREGLAQQLRRMLADPRSNALVENFAGQWLQLRNLKGLVPNPDTFPDFDDNLRQAFRREAELFFASVVREDRNVLDLMTADYTFVNERLAKHYGLPGVFGSALPPRDADRRRAARTARQGRRPARHLARDDDVAGPAGEVGAREPAGLAAAPAAARRAGPAGRRARGAAPHDARADGAAPEQPRLRVVPQDDGPVRVRAGELRRGRRLATDERNRASPSTRPTSCPTA